MTDENKEILINLLKDMTTKSTGEWSPCKFETFLKWLDFETTQNGDGSWNVKHLNYNQLDETTIVVLWDLHKMTTLISRLTADFKLTQEVIKNDNITSNRPE